MNQNRLSINFNNKFKMDFSNISNCQNSIDNSTIFNEANNSNDGCNSGKNTKRQEKNGNSFNII